jgi:hypothetical protein
MGTSTNYKGSPNWGPLKSETTQTGGEGHVTPQKAASIVGGFVGQMQRDSQFGFGAPLSSGGSGSGRGGNAGGGGGGRRGGGTGQRAGKTARAVARGVGSFLADVRTKGFREALAERGLTNLDGKSPDEIALAIADLLSGPASLIEQTALRNALMELVLKWSEGVEQIDELANAVAGVAENIEGALRDFFGHYIFEVFKTVGYQGVLATHGFDKAESMTNQIRDFINAKISGVGATRSLTSIDWNGADGARIVDAIVTDTIAIFGETQS